MYFIWEGMKKDIHNFVVAYGTCQQHKGEIMNSLGVVQPLPIPNHIWTNISMDFIMDLSNDPDPDPVMMSQDDPDREMIQIQR